MSTEVIAREWSVVIPTLNEERNIGRCLDSLCELTLERDSFEIVVCDNGSRDNTLRIVECYSKRLNLAILKFPSLAIGALRNAGAKVASGRYLAFLDADCTVAPDWLKQATRFIEEHRNAVVGFPYTIPESAGWPARLWQKRFHAGRGGDVSYVPAGNLLVAKPIFWSIGGFDAQLRSNEDSQFCSRARCSGMRVLAFPQLVVTHFGAEKNLAHFIRRQLWHGSNVISGLGLRGNARAISLAFYTFACLAALLGSILLRSPMLLAGGFVGIVLPPFFLACCGPRIGFKRFGPLSFLLLVYGVVRACVLPLALFRGLQRWTAGRAV